MRQRSACLLLLAALPLCAHAGQAHRGVYWSADAGASYNPLGAVVDGRLLTRFPLVQRPGVLWESTRIDLGVQDGWTPADNLLQAFVKIEPIAFFDVTLRGGLYSLYNTLGYGYYRFESPCADYGPEALRRLTPGKAAGYWLSAAPCLKLRAGKIIALNTFTANALSSGSGGYFLEVRSYTLHKGADVDLGNDLNVVYQLGEKVMAGAGHHWFRVNGTKASTQRLAALLVVLPGTSRIGESFVAATIGGYLSDPRFKGAFYIGVMAGTEVKAW